MRECCCLIAVREAGDDLVQFGGGDFLSVHFGDHGVGRDGRRWSGGGGAARLELSRRECRALPSPAAELEPATASAVTRKSEYAKIFMLNTSESSESTHFIMLRLRVARCAVTARRRLRRASPVRAAAVQRRAFGLGLESPEILMLFTT